MGRVVAVILVCAAAGLIAAAAADDGRMRITAVVTGPRGEPLPGLRPRDFELRADGVAQELESVQLTRLPADTPRVFALLIDEFHIDAESTARVRDALTYFVDAALRPSDLVIALRPLDPLTTLEATHDRTQLRSIIAAFEGRKGDYAPRTLFEEKYMPQAPAAVAAARAQIVTSALRAITARLAEMTEVRSAIVFVSDGFDRTQASRESPADLQTVIRPANSAAAPVYVMSPSARLTGEGAEAAERAAAAVRALATQTGGEFTAGTEPLRDAMVRVSRDLDIHYVLTYKPTHGEDGRFHALQLELKRRNAQVRTRTGYLAAISPQMRAARAAARASLTTPRALRRSQLITSWSGFTRNSEGGTRVVLTWEPRRAATAIRRAAPDAIVVTASTPGGEVIFQGRIAPVGAARPADWRDSAVFDAPAGRLLIDMNIVDAAGAVLDFDARDLDVPDLQKPGVIMLPASVLRARSAREFRAVSVDPNASPVASREFRRTDRLLVRVPAYDDGRVAAVTATLLNGWRQPMRQLTALPEAIGDGVTQFDVPLAPLAPGEYVIRITGPGVAEHVAFRVTG